MAAGMMTWPSSVPLSDGPVCTIAVSQMVSREVSLPCESAEDADGGQAGSDAGARVSLLARFIVVQPSFLLPFSQTSSYSAKSDDEVPWQERVWIITLTVATSTARVVNLEM